jgi:hypothetical protein
MFSNGKPLIIGNPGVCVAFGDREDYLAIAFATMNSVSRDPQLPQRPFICTSGTSPRQAATNAARSAHPSRGAGGARTFRISRSWHWLEAARARSPAHAMHRCFGRPRVWRGHVVLVCDLRVDCMRRTDGVRRGDSALLAGVWVKG